MTRITLLLSLGFAAALGTGVWLFQENHNLRQELADAEVSRVAAKSVRPAASSGSPASTRQPAGAAIKGGPVARGGPASSVAANPAPASAGKESLRIADNGNGTFMVSDPSGTWQKVMSAEEVRNLSRAMDSAMQASVTKLPGGPSWSPGRAAGAPDTAGHGDYSTAWASQSPDSGKEWLQVKYQKSVEISEINIHETYNPGAISKVSALMPDGSERVIWEGTMDPGQDVIERAVKVPPGVRSDQIRIELDTSRVPGWNEIDAVELVGRDGSRQWGVESKASSYFGESRGQAMVFTEQLYLGGDAALPAAADR